MPGEEKSGFGTFSEVKYAIDLDFGYFCSKVGQIHSQIQRIDTQPIKDSSLTLFKSHMSSFYNDIYFGNIGSALSWFKKAKRVKTTLGKVNDSLLNSFNFNDMMIGWIKGRVSASKVSNLSEKILGIQLLQHSNTYKNLWKTIKLT